MKSLVPPRLVRRLVVAPLVVLVCLLFVVLSARCCSSPRSWSTSSSERGLGLTRLTAFAIVFAAAEAAMILALFVPLDRLRLRPARGSNRRHYAAAARLAAGAVVRRRQSLLGLKIVVLDAPEPRAGPLLVFGRHAGLGNSVMMIRQLMVRFDRRPRVVMLAFLQWDPVVDIVCHRLPSLFIDHDPEHSDDFVRKIGDLARGMGDRDALRPLPGGQRLHRAPAAAGDRLPAPQGPPPRGRTGGGDGARAAAAAPRPARRDPGGPGGGRRPRRPHRARGARLVRGARTAGSRSSGRSRPATGGSPPPRYRTSRSR